MGRRQRRWGLVASLIIAGLIWGVRRSANVRRARTMLAEARAAVNEGRYASASRRLDELLTERPGAAEAAYLLGICEQARGRDTEAEDAWASVPVDSPFGPQAIQRRMERRIDRGRFADAEALIKRSIADPRLDGTALDLYLGPAYWLQGRIRDAEESIEARWEHLGRRGEDASEQAVALVRLHIELRLSPQPVEVVRVGLEQAGRMAPDDDRVRLGQANLDLRTGNLEEAGRRLDVCLLRRPDDVSVWRARLGWALATGRVAEMEEAMRHLPPDPYDPAQAPRLSAWLARARGDRTSERRLLGKVVEADPGDPDALDRLAALDPDRADELRRRKSEIGSLLARYDRLFRRNQPLRDAAEMARIADRLGRRFESRGFATFALAVDPDREDLRRELVPIVRRGRPARPAAASLADAPASMPEPAAPPDSPGAPGTSRN